MTMQEIAIDDNKVITMVTSSVAGDIEVIYDLECKEGTIFFGEIEIECKMTAGVLSSLSDLSESASLFEKVRVLQRIERLSKKLII